jgi:hypothetical protein
LTTFWLCGTRGLESLEQVLVTNFLYFAKKKCFTYIVSIQKISFGKKNINKKLQFRTILLPDKKKSVTKKRTKEAIM